ncbi:hypothetical protein [Allosalinactinospora lopnorensis]|uniref:hypothetical protein n=1 Tax=Allosalinactinospora lopnorensis TaxID=1352348 RepID=UPI001F32E793|nr:hypothetical protein [Allosalinactinospora lopnorensis]
MRTTEDWQSWLLPGLHWLAREIPATLPVIITGLSRPNRIATAVDLFGHRMALVNTTAQSYGLHGEVMGPNGRQQVHAKTSDAFRSSVAYFASLMPTRSLT